MTVCKGYISSIYNGSAVDGPGLRCVIFFSGCNLRCPFCHNPETFELQSGKVMTASELILKVLRYKNYIKNGGVTISGGEPFMQPDFLGCILDALKENSIHSAVETNATIINKDLIGKADLLIADIKNFDGIMPQSKDFLKECFDQNVKVNITNVIVKGVNDDKESLLKLKQLLQPFSNIGSVTFLPFRKLCINKYESLNMVFPYREKEDTTSDRILEVKELYNSL